MAESAPLGPRVLDPPPIGFQPIVTVADLALWARATIPVGDEFATAVVNLSSRVVADASRQAGWLNGTVVVPHDAYVICLRLARRTFVNTDGVVVDTTGPITERVLDEMAASMRLTDAELEALSKLSPTGSTTGGTWVLSGGGGLPGLSSTAYLHDSSGSDWGIPYADYSETDGFNQPTDTYLP